MRSGSRFGNKDVEREKDESKRTVSSTVVRSLEDDDVVLSSSSSSDLDGSFDSLGSRVPQEEGVEVGSGHAVEETVDC